ILITIQKIKDSKEPVRRYFRNNYVPFSQAQYYNYCKILQKYGEEGLVDKRIDGNRTKLTERIKDYIIYTVSENRSMASSQLQKNILSQFDVNISESSLNTFRASESLTRIPETKETTQYQKSGGGEILTSLAFSTKIIDIFTNTILGRMNEVRQSQLFEQNITNEEDHPDLRFHGKFTKDYNREKDVRENRFKSIDEKIQNKNFSAMDIFGKSEESISRYNLALLCLPLVTSNGKSSRVNRPKGNDLEFLCGYNYKDASLDKYLRDLKYLKVSEQLINEIAKYWLNFWKQESGDETYFACYYIDGNTKPLWSSNSHYKGKVTMLGRVMNCLENVFIHDGKGHPLYFQTFQGHVDLGKHALEMQNKLMQLLDTPSAHIQVNRILIMDGGGNSVKTLRELSKSEEYFITILDDNQTKDRKFKHIREETKYEYGKANLTDCKIELLDSSEKGYIFECRAVIIKWNNGRKAVLVTDVPRQLLNESEITKRYFDRWPMQEKTFRETKSVLYINNIVGYGTKIESYDKMIDKHKEICETITKLKSKLKVPLKEMKEIDEQLSDIYTFERTLRKKSEIIEGKRVLNEEDSIKLKHNEAEISKCLNKQIIVKSKNGDDFKKLEKCLKEEKRLRGKDKVYRIDIELDRIMTCFKMSFVNLCSLFLKGCFNNEKMELLTLFESIFQLDGSASISNQIKTIELEMNPKEPK
ncbi:MAG: helix-turn-helix domain-containing protein, partial [ANME-2 cluster archaeon]|nr:helix-turn-helix domain-containing protein [ANME-2 cluster archaeon]